MKQKLKGKPSVTADEFDQLTGIFKHFIVASFFFVNNLIF
jgi:hypothetical protein